LHHIVVDLVVRCFGCFWLLFSFGLFWIL
jgi:hypothetical protein